ncbi:hypothetical protein niasHT_031013 [Heterodera trifolii]|uniref:Uncharacterized protein n=1 Tax=Heterodera trifolii TaxID=157864 RepID=A0ABD2ID99_9BILA
MIILWDEVVIILFHFRQRLAGVFELLEPSQLGLGIALISHRFDFYVDQHFKTRKRTLKIIRIRRKIGENRAKQMEIVNLRGKSLPIPQKPLPDKVIVFKQIFIPINLIFHTVPDQILEFVLHNIWPMLGKNIHGMGLSVGIFHRFRKFAPSILNDCPSLQFVSFFCGDFLIEFPWDDSAEASDGQSVVKWLFTPLQNNVPKVLKCIFLGFISCQFHCCHLVGSIAVRTMAVRTKAFRTMAVRTIGIPLYETPLYETPLYELPIVRTAYCTNCLLYELPIVRTALYELPLYELPIVRTAYCTNCLLYELPIVRTANCTNCIVRTAFVRTAHCTNCLLYELPIVRTAYCTNCQLYELHCTNCLCTNCPLYELPIVRTAYCTNCLLYELPIVRTALYELPLYELPIVRTAMTPIWFVRSPFPISVVPFDVTNEFTLEQLMLKKIDDNSSRFLLVRCPIARDESKWTKWEKEAIGWHIHDQWNQINIHIFREDQIGDGLLNATPDTSDH